MARQNQSQRINALAAVVQDLAEMQRSVLEIYFPGSESAQQRLEQLKAMCTSIVSERDGFPSLESEVTTHDFST